MPLLRNELNLPVAASVDVLVCGGGTAGAVAAIASCREGCQTLVIEQLGALGGTQSMAWVTPMMPNKILEESLSHGINDLIIKRCAELDSPPTNRSGDLLWFNPITLAYVLDELLNDFGGRALFHTMISDVILDGDQIVGVVIENKAGRQAVLAKIMIDCTGDADVAFRAGVPCMSDGDEENGGYRQPMSLRFNLGNVGIDQAVEFLVDELGLFCYSRSPLFEMWAGDASLSPLGGLIKQAIEQTVLESGDLGYLQCFSMLGRPNELAFNCPRIPGLDPNSPWDLSKAQQIGRQKIQRIAKFFKSYVRGFETSYIAVIAPMVGVRESRRIIGEYILTEKDYFSEARFDDVIAKNSYPIDIHTTTGTTLKHLPPGHYHEIPYRCLVPKKFDGLLAAGRCVSATFTAQAAIRIQQNCRSMGEAAGIAAALCIETHKTPRLLDTDLLLERISRRLSGDSSGSGRSANG